MWFVFDFNQTRILTRRNLPSSPKRTCIIIIKKNLKKKKLVDRFIYFCAAKPHHEYYKLSYTCTISCLPDQQQLCRRICNWYNIYFLWRTLHVLKYLQQIIPCLQEMKNIVIDWIDYNYYNHQLWFCLVST